MLYHPIPPLYDENSKILILGSFPSPLSREAGFFYANPRNRFWKTLAAVLCDERFTRDNAAKRAACLDNGIALWDVLHCCEIDGADDSSIKNAQPNDFAPIFAAADIKQVFTTGKTATALYEKFCGKKSVYLPSTSPAYPVSESFLAEKYRVILDYLR